MRQLAPDETAALLRRLEATAPVLLDLLGGLEHAVALHAEGTVVWANAALALLLGARSAPALRGMFLSQVTAPTAQAQVRARMELLEQGHALERATLEAMTLDGRPVRLEVMSTLLPPTVVPGMVMSFLADVTGLAAGADGTAQFASLVEHRRARLEAERRLELSEARYRALFETARDGIFVCDPHGVYVEVNPAGCALLGYTAAELVGRNLRDFVAPTEVETLRLPEVAGGLGLVTERSMWRKDGTAVRVEIASSLLPGGLMQGRVRDLTERHRAEEALRQAARVEGVGRLAGGVAHDFNNLLTVVMSLTRLLKDRLEGDGASLALLEELDDTSERAAQLTRHLLAFSRRQPANPRVVDLNVELRRCASFLRRAVREDVRLEYQLGAEPLLLRIDPTHLEQVIVNLAVNARDAMPDGGQITFLTRPGAGDEVVLEVADTGQGISEAVLPHIFEPFFTTKASGVGTGLGLATVQGIVTQARGRVQVRSSPTGATFTLTFPRSEAPRETPPVRRSPVPGLPPARVLLVEDDGLVRAGMERSLRAAGHGVYVAPDLDLALAVVHSGAPLDLLVTDVVMPGADGRQVAAAVRNLRPGLPVLFVTGYAPEPESLPGAVLNKPFTPAALRDAVQQVLADPDLARGSSHRPGPD